MNPAEIMHLHTMSRLDHRGHGPIARWSPSDKASVEKARQVFEEHRQKRFSMYDVTKKPGHEDGEVMREFNPEAEEIIVAPRLIGG